MAIQQNFPAIKPTLNLDFANTKALDPRITFTRASTARYYGTETAKAEENLIIRSQEFDNAYWPATNATVTANATTAPDGTTTAETLTEDTASGVHNINSDLLASVLANTTYTVSCFVKNVSRDRVDLIIRGNTSNYGGAEFNLTSATTSTFALGTGYSVTSATMTDVGGGWYRCVATVVVGTNISAMRVFLALSDGAGARDTSGRRSYTGTGLSVQIWGAQLEQRAQATAYQVTTTQPITNYIPVLETAANNVLRLDHNPTTFESLGLLIEEQRTNLATYSEQFDDAYWTKTRLSITANTIVAPDGMLTGDKLVENTDSGGHFIQGSSVAVTAGTTYTFTIYAKAAGRAWLRLTGNTAGLVGAAYYNLQTGTLGAVASGTTASMTPVGNGWYRCTFTRTETVNANLAFLVSVTNADNTSTYTGDGYSGIYIWGAQLEAGAFPTSYIPTVASQVTRAADAASMTGANFSSWYRADEGTIYIETQVNFLNAVSRMASINDGTVSNRILAYNRAGATTVQYIVSTSGVTQASIVRSVVSGSAMNKQAVVYKQNDFAASANGSVVGTDNLGTVPVVNRLTLGFEAGFKANGTIKKISYYPLRLSDTNLQALTS